MFPTLQRFYAANDYEPCDPPGLCAWQVPGPRGHPPVALLTLLLRWGQAHSLPALLGGLLATVWLCMLREAWGRLPWGVWVVGVGLGIVYALRWA